MKVAIVPAQITTIEDRVGGNLTILQLVLLISPVILSGIVYALFPPSFRLTAYKLTLSVIFELALGPLAIRIKGETLLHWVVIATRYNLRPRYYIFNKNDLYLREMNSNIKTAVPRKRGSTSDVARARPSIEFEVANLALLEQLVNNSYVGAVVKPLKGGGIGVTAKKVG